MEKQGSTTFQIPGLGEVSLASSEKRRRETVAAYFLSLYFMIPATFLVWITSFYLLFFCKIMAVKVLLVGYFTFAFVIDKSPKTGSRLTFLRSNANWVWSHACDYFPITLVKTAELDPKKSYVMGYHPHGVISVGAMCSFATDGAQTRSVVKKETGGFFFKKKEATPSGEEKNNVRGFSSLFPGIDRRLVTLPTNFQTPILREYILSMGCCDSSKETFRNVLSRNNGEGNALVVVVGGAAESMLVQPGTMDLLLKTRRGFVREAIIANASLVPVIAFGETDLYQVFEPGSHWVRSFQERVKSFTGVALPIFNGRSLFFKDFGLMPQRKPIEVVVGAPLDPPKLAEEQRKNFYPKFDRETKKAMNDDAKIVEKFHNQYVEAVEQLYSKLKNAKWNEPGRNRKRSLVIK